MKSVNYALNESEFVSSPEKGLLNNKILVQYVVVPFVRTMHLLRYCSLQKTKFDRSL